MTAPGRPKLGCGGGGQDPTEEQNDGANVHPEAFHVEGQQAQQWGWGLGQELVASSEAAFLSLRENLSLTPPQGFSRAWTRPTHTAEVACCPPIS